MAACRLLDVLVVMATGGILTLTLAMNGSEISASAHGQITADSFMEGPFRKRLQNLTISDEKRLTQYLLWKYSLAGRGGRPVHTTTNVTNVDFGLGLIQMDLDERNKVLITSMWTRLSWRDAYLTWDPAEFGGVTSVRLYAEQVWLPDIMLYNTADPENEARNALVVVFHTGVLQWVPHQIFRSSCSIDVTNFPFDKQKCYMWFGSWTYTLGDLDLNNIFKGGIDLETFKSDYKETCEWDIEEALAEKLLLPPGDPNPIAVLSFTLKLKRKLVFSSYILTLPCIFLASLTMVVFWLPPDRPDRTALAMNLFSSFLLLLLILVEAAPPTATSVPVIGLYYCFNMVIIMLSVFLSTLVVNVYRAGEFNSNIPKWMDVLVLKILARCVCIRTSSDCCKCEKSGLSTPSACARSRDSEDTDLRRVHTATNCRGTEEADEKWKLLNSPDANNSRSSFSGEHLSHSGQGLDPNYAALYRQLDDVRRALRQILNTSLQRDQEAMGRKLIVNQWRAAARVLDRVFFLLYLFAIIASLVLLFPKPSGLDEQETT